MPRFNTPVVFQDGTSQATAAAGGSTAAIDAELGTNPSGSFATVADRLNARLTCRKTADQTLSSTITATNITDMLLPVATTGLDYYFRFIIIYQSNTLTNGFRTFVTCPTVGGYFAAVINIYGRVANTAAQATPPLMVYSGTINGSGQGVVSDGVGQINFPYVCTVEGILSNPTATGSIQFQAANEVSTASGNVVKRGSWGEVYIN